MVNSIKSGARVADHTPERRQAQRGDGVFASHAAGPHAVDPAQGSDLRLVIERDAQGDYYIYRLIDRATGAVVKEWGREEVAKLAEGESYAAGTMIRTKA